MKVREDHIEFSNGHQGVYGVVEKDDFALIVPWDGTHFHLVKQFRYPTQVESIEFPQGVHENDPQADPTKLARAELQEEIGLVARKMEEIGFFYEAPGYSNQGFHLFFASELIQGETSLDVTEENLVHLTMTVKEFEEAVLDGTITDAPTISAYGLLKIKKLI